ncbi:unnamed protein product [Somion occarium]|uniref:Uncharacterized protein n=1 Tax=Somion occarium TaxID=3059160 RepID=A0ABP1D8H2_9APHY
MTSESSSLFSLARNKLHSVVGGNVKDSASLHRWVLLKNVIIRSHIADAPASSSDNVGADPVYRHEEEEHHDEAEQDSFMFPDPDDLLADEDSDVGSREDQWLDSLLETLGDDEEDLDDSLTLSNPRNHEEDEPLSPLYSPMSSSDDLVGQSSFYYPPEIAIPYPVPYPPLHPPLVPSWLALERSNDDPSLTPSPPLYHDPLPYFHQDDIEDLSVPDAIEDTSDDESDAPCTPSTTSTSSLSPPNASLPLPHERTRPHPHVYIGTDDSYFYPFERDPLPFSDTEHPDGSGPRSSSPLSSQGLASFVTTSSLRHVAEHTEHTMCQF